MTKLDFLFSEDCVHTSFCDECSGEPTEEIESVWERFNNISKKQIKVFFVIEDEHRQSI